MLALGAGVGVGHMCHLFPTPVLALASTSPAAAWSPESAMCSGPLITHRRKVQSGQQTGPRAHSRTISLSVTLSCFYSSQILGESGQSYVSSSCCLSFQSPTKRGGDPELPALTQASGGPARHREPAWGRRLFSSLFGFR